MDKRILHIDGFTLEEELEWLYDTALALPAGSLIVELGAWKGRSTAALYKGAGLGKTVVSIDTWLGQPSMREEEQVDVKEYDVFLRFMSNMAYMGTIPSWFYADMPSDIPQLGYYYLRMDSIEAAALKFGRGIDMLFIDDDHERCEEVCHAWIPHVREGGIVCGHDYSEAFPRVRQAVDARFPEHRRVGSLWIAPMVIWHMDHEKEPECKS